jgi:DNA-directed RNA polymerase subunit RPC12/RpoP
MSDEFYDKEYDEAFILRAVAISHVRSRSLKEVALVLCVPVELLEKWKNHYAKKIKIQYLPDKHLRNLYNPFIHAFPNYSKVKKSDSEHCPGCNSRIVFNLIRSLPVQQKEGAYVSALNSWTKTSGPYSVTTSYMKVITERIEQCPNCNLYIIRFVSEKIASSEI